MVQKLRYRDILKNGQQIHLTRATLTSERPKALHDHDFFEVFWVQNGTVRHHLPKGNENLTEGSVVFMRPGQTHGLQGRGTDSMIVSVSIHPATIKALSKRHPSLHGHLFWAAGDDPIQVLRDSKQLATINHAAVQLERGRHDTLAAEAFLLPLCAALVAQASPPNAPSWLADACKAAEDPAIFAKGSAGLVALTGKAHPHVSRTMREHFDLTPSDYVNGIRMRYAARALITDADSVSQIAQDCGIPNMSHFHKLFRASFQMTPLQYRQTYQRQIVQPA